RRPWCQDGGGRCRRDIDSHLDATGRTHPRGPRACGGVAEGGAHPPQRAGGRSAAPRPGGSERDRGVRSRESLAIRGHRGRLRSLARLVAQPALSSMAAHHDQESVSEGGMFRSLSRFSSTLLGIVHTRIELLRTELQEEVQYAAKLALWGFVAAFAGLDRKSIRLNSSHVK